MPMDYGDNDSLDIYVETCIESLLATTDVHQYCIVCDMNCSNNSRFFPVPNQPAVDNSSTFIDLKLLSNVVTYRCDNGLLESWIDHVLGSLFFESHMISMHIPDEFFISDHKPIMFTVQCKHHVPISSDDSQVAMTPRWDKVDANKILTYRSLLDKELSCIAMTSNICSTHSKCFL